MSTIASTVLLASSDCSATNSHAGTNCGFEAPSVTDFNLKAIFHIGSIGFYKPELLALISAGLVVWFFWAAFSKPKLVPRGIQNLGEMGYLFIRDQIARPMIGKTGDRFVPFLLGLFFFIWVMNLMEIIPVAQVPVTAFIAFPASLMLMVYITYWYQAIKNQGFFGFLKNVVPTGVPWPVLIILVPVEWLRVLVIQPFTLMVRLFANMFAGHLLLATFTIATWYLASATFSLIFAAGSAVMVVVLTAFEMLIQALQAYIFTMLTAQYVGEGVQAAH
ncbi:F0F1 ATP synthase subunit A [Actinospica sp. MGRD01-02]|uniref:ATP synthase subunit a n=1 Tax=Actinospica acidithermotolerans TaxID=2828514 RepID=A0A941IIP6_9ACTN|nr:F0F1 ATP synthase subunit A [Actinospica acidithermotolerans]MBR7824966.1 F0F1 ATP synthase subunit A [Actinospica acidithermotolerans]